MRDATGHVELLDEPPRSNMPKARGYRGKVLDVAGTTGENNAQTKMALAEFNRDDSVADELYGFSGGGYNVRHIIKAIPHDDLSRLKLIVVLGAPGNSPDLI